jgi:DNA end-binding protein Ku
MLSIDASSSHLPARESNGDHVLLDLKTSRHVTLSASVRSTGRSDGGAEAFVVIRDAMQDEERVALARIVMAHREHIITLEPLGKGLLGTTLRYDYEVRKENEYFTHIPSPRISKDMVELAAHILESKATKFDPEKFRDEYEKALRKLVQRKAKGHAIEAPEPLERPSNVINLMDALRESIKSDSGSRRGAKRKAARKQKTRGRTAA